MPSIYRGLEETVPAIYASAGWVWAVSHALRRQGRMRSVCRRMLPRVSTVA